MSVGTIIKHPTYRSNSRNTEFIIASVIRKSDATSALIIPTFKESVIINDETYSVTKVIHNIDELDITVILK